MLAWVLNTPLLLKTLFFQRIFHYPVGNYMFNMFKVNNKDTGTTLLSSFWCLYCQLGTYFTPFFSVSIVNFDQVNAGWV